MDGIRQVFFSSSSPNLSPGPCADPLHQAHSVPLASRSPSTLTNDDIEAVIQMATSSRGPDGRPGPLKDTRTQLFVGNLPYRVRWQDLKDLFRRAGTVLRADVSLGPDNRSRGYGTVLLATAEDAGRAIDLFNGYSWQTRILEVRPDRLPPDYDANHPPPIVSGALPPSLHGPKSSEELDYSTILDIHHNFPGAISSSLRTLFVGNLPFHCQWQDLKDLFRQAGTIMRADVALGPDGRSRGFGTVTFAVESDAERAVKMFNGYEYNGRMLKVNHDKFNQPAQPTALSAGATPSSSMSPMSISPAPSVRSAPDARVFQGRSLASFAQPSNTMHNLGLGAPSSNAPSPFQWISQQNQLEAKPRDERELFSSFQRMGLGSRMSSTQSSYTIQGPGPVMSRSTSTSSSTKPPSVMTSTSSISAVSSSSSVADPASTSSTTEKPLQPLPPSLARHRRLSSSQQQQSGVPSPTSSTSSSTPLKQPLQPQPQPPTRASHRSPSSHHPRHPGPISLPPPPSATAFPLHHHNHNPGMPPHGISMVGFSPLHHPLGSPSSPLFHPHHMSHQQQIPHQMTPHGLPPITPSMPSFNFLPPAASPSSKHNTHPAHAHPQHQHQHQHQHAHTHYSPYTHTHALPLPLPSPLGMGMGIGMVHMLMQTPGSPVAPHPHPHPLHHAHPHAPFGITPLSPPASATVPTFAAAAAAGKNSSTSTQYAAAFSPGVAMSPGAFYGRPGGAAPNPMINPAVGAPVHVHHQQPAVGGGVLGGGGGGNGDANANAVFYSTAAGGVREPTGYFDGVGGSGGGYFPPVFVENGDGKSEDVLGNELMKDIDEDRVGEPEREGELQEEVEEEEDHTEELEQEQERGCVSRDEVDEVVLDKERPREERVRRHSSSTAAKPWQTPGDLRVWEGREPPATATKGKAKDARTAPKGGGLLGLEFEFELGLGEGLGDVQDGGGAPPVILRTHSMSSKKKPPEMTPAALSTLGRSGSDPIRSAGDMDAAVE
ncbi:hypothetical protein H0H81_007568 [Sphagnurus paluster]|uniref:RRM domain-containing protein n=1 Tax=Sphagnurus paluster TaxID=117069 RepID=A0A9P7GKL6_9AGAR|nr:hypothetical protein H0H81_007568 [Sphagnurus paluster]